jgi:hypothetical protein
MPPPQIKVFKLKLYIFILSKFQKWQKFLYPSSKTVKSSPSNSALPTSSNQNFPFVRGRQGVLYFERFKPL